MEHHTVKSVKGKKLKADITLPGALIFQCVMLAAAVVSSGITSCGSLF